MSSWNFGQSPGNATPPENFKFNAGSVTSSTDPPSEFNFDFGQGQENTDGPPGMFDNVRNPFAPNSLGDRGRTASGQSPSSPNNATPDRSLDHALPPKDSLAHHAAKTAPPMDRNEHTGFVFGSSASYTFGMPAVPHQRDLLASTPSNSGILSHYHSSPSSSVPLNLSSSSPPPVKKIEEIPPRSRAASPNTTSLEGQMESLSVSSTAPQEICQILNAAPPAEVAAETQNNPHESLSEAAHAAGSTSGAKTITPYDVLQEGMPDCKFYSPEVRESIQTGFEIARIAEEATEALGSTLPLDDSAKRILGQIKDVRSLQGIEARHVAILGDSGEGKSSLINSLLHYPGIAQTGDIGSACTSVVTEYRQKRPEDTAPITIEAEYLSSTGIEEHISELLWSYRQLYLPILESASLSPKDYTRIQRESEQAWSALQTAFGDRRQLSKSYLQNQDEGAYESIKTQLCKWADEIQWPAGADSGVWKSTASTADECCDKTRIFMQDRYWPFTKIIRVYIDSQVLKTGMILADLPGLQDTNLARVRATQKYLLQCDNIFIVSKIARAITNQSVKSSLYHVLSQHMPMEWEQSGGKHLRVAVVCTMSEDINLNTARTEFCGPGKRLSNDEVSQLEGEVASAKIAGDRPRKKEAKERLKFVFVKARNAHVKEGLQRAYSSELDVPQGQLNVFCVSNTTYEKYSRKGKTEFVQDSGIPAVRQFCHSITADAQLRHARQVLQCELAGRLNSLILWASSLHSHVAIQADQSYEPIEQALLRIAFNLPSRVSEMGKKFLECFQEQLTSFLDQRGLNWESAAKSKAAVWERWHWTQYNAWCVHFGLHATANLDRVDWNAEIIWKMRLELEYPWELVIDEISVIFASLRDDWIDDLRSLTDSIKECMRPEQVLLLVGEIELAISSLKYKLELVERTFIRDIEIIRRRASDSSASSYVVNEMTPAYRLANSQMGTGMAARQKAAVRGHITGGILFPNIIIAVSNDVNSVVAETKLRLKGDVEPVFITLEENVKMALKSARQRCSNTDRLQNSALSEFERKLKTLKEDIEALEL
uniref:G domain-containing protein n=2 Tax=Clonostachys TaxID=110564 RepID=A0A8H7K460_BIOOC